MHLRRREVQAYLIGAAVAGTLLVLPYTGRALASRLAPELVAVDVPFFLLPIVWGLWNWLWVRLRTPCAAGTWGALLGLQVALALNVLRAARGDWFPAAGLLVVWLPPLYALAWVFVVAPLNRALEAHP